MINKLTTVHSVISKVVRDLGLGDNEVPWQDMIEWMAEGLEFIGSYYQFKEKEAIILVEDFKGVLPCDFHKPIKYLEGCSMGNLGSGPFWTLVNSVLKDTGFQDADNDNVIDMLSFQKIQLMHYNKTGYNKNFYRTLQHNRNLMGAGSTFTGLDNSYNVNLDTITAGFRFGSISLRYLAMPVDEQGYPLIPDDVAFREALMWRCAEKMAMRGYQFKNTQLNDFEVGKFYWNKYCMQARGNANAPDPEMMQRLANIWGTLAPNYKEYYEDFNNLGANTVYNLNGDR